MIECCNEKSVANYKDVSIPQSPAVVKVLSMNTNEDVINILDYTFYIALPSLAVQLCFSGTRKQ